MLKRASASWLNAWVASASSLACRANLASPDQALDSANGLRPMKGKGSGASSRNADNSGKRRSEASRLARKWPQTSILLRDPRNA